jgi:hypothetical protein
MTHYLKVSDTITVFSGNCEFTQKLPTNIYQVAYNQQKGYFLNQFSDSNTIPEKIYGKSQFHADRVIETFDKKKTSIGVLLSGIKGTGKTLTAKIISEICLSRNIPTIIINESYSDSDFCKFITDISEECVIIFDEFEKVYYDEKDQEKILTLFDGVYSNRKLFIFTINDISKINKHMLSRNSRIHYHFRYSVLSDEMIVEYCNEKLKDLTKRDDIITVSKGIGSFSFDNLQAIVWECNNYPDLSVKEICDDLNLEFKPMNNDSYKIKSIFDKVNNKIIDTVFYDDTSLYNDSSCSVRFYLEKECDEEIRINFNSSNIKLLDYKNGEISYENEEYIVNLHSPKMENMLSFLI